MSINSRKEILASEKVGTKKNADKTVMRTLAYALGLMLRVVVLVCLVGYLGIDTSGNTALIASFGVCIGLAVNGALANGNIINYSEKELRRVDIDFYVSYASDSEKAKSIAMEVLEKHELVLQDPAPFVRVSGRKESAVEIKTRAWVKNADYWTVYFDVTEAVKAAYEENGIEIPFDQVDVHIKNQ